MVVFERQIFEEADGAALRVVVWSRVRNEQRQTVRHAAESLKSTDDGKTWRHEAAIIPGGEPAVAKLSPTEMTCVIRGERLDPVNGLVAGRWQNLEHPRVLEEGCVDPDLELMSNGVLACSYGRPTSCVMFSIDQGRTWIEHRVVSERAGFDYTSLREISPGRLLFVHDAPTLSGVYIDVERREGLQGGMMLCSIHQISFAFAFRAGLLGLSTIEDRCRTARLFYRWGECTSPLLPHRLHGRFPRRNIPMICRWIVLIAFLVWASEPALLHAQEKPAQAAKPEGEHWRIGIR